MQLEAALPQSFRILVIAAHPDDIEFGSGGSAATWTSAGAEVVYCIVTDGAAGSNAPDYNREALIAQRRAEQVEAAAIAGVSDVRFLGYPDGALTPTLELRRDLTRVIRQVRPQRVVITDPTVVFVSGDGFDYINHPDHRAAGEAALYAVFPSAETRPIFPELLAEGLEPHHVEEVYLNMAERPNVAVDVTAVWERKISALLAHRSQVGEQVRELIHGWDMATGREAGVPLAESFRVMWFGRRGEEPETPASA